MRVEVNERPGGLLDLVLGDDEETFVLTEHGLRDIEFELARRRAMSRRCLVTRDEHTCALAPGHVGVSDHVCRGCTEIWRDAPEGGEADDTETGGGQAEPGHEDG